MFVISGSSLCPGSIIVRFDCIAMHYTRYSGNSLLRTLLQGISTYYSEQIHVTQLMFLYGTLTGHSEFLI